MLTKKVGTERVQQILQGIRPNDHYFDGARVLNGDGEITRRDQYWFHGSFQGSPSPGSAGSTVTVYRDSNPQTSATDSSDLARTFGSIPGGVILDGTADQESFESLTYDSRFNALVLDDRTVYFLKISPKTTIELCEALAQDDRIGVSIGQVFISYGALSKDSELAQDLMMTDQFLGDVAFGLLEWTKDYTFADGYVPQPYDFSISSISGAAFFRFGGFQFRQEGQELQLAEASFEDRFIPLSDQKAADGGGLPDEAKAGYVPEGMAMNLRHLAQNMKYYRQENLIQQTIAYGEAAALLRGLKQQGLDLAELAQAIRNAP